MVDAAHRLSAIRARIAKAGSVARRRAGEITLVAVAKGRTMDEIAPLIEAGQRDFGESRVQEALDKWPPVLARHPDLRLHGIGRLQSNKAVEAVRLFDVIHALDRRSLLDALIAASAREGRTPSVYVQVNIGDEPQKGGCTIADLEGLIADVRATELPLAGLMAIPPADAQPGPYFALLAKLARRHDVSGLSMGMSDDFETAIQLGATCVRVGSALFEER